MNQKRLRAVDLSKILKPFENKWVALSMDRKKVLASGKTLEQANKEAQKTGQKFLFHKVMSPRSLLVPVPLRRAK